jgi:hypothetical protein
MEPSFNDSTGRTWTLKLNVGTIDRLRKLGVDLAPNNIVQGVATLESDTEKLAKALWVLCRNQAEADGVTQEQLADALDGDALDAGAQAIRAAAVAYAPARVRPAMFTALEQIDDAAAKHVAAIESELSNPELAKRLEAAVLENVKTIFAPLATK